MMINHTRIMMILCIAQLMSFGVDVYACLTTFINDKGGKVLILDRNGGEPIIPIGKNEKRRFGSQHEHAHFVIYTQEPKARLFTPLYTCKQNECGGNGNIQLKFSDIENSTGSAHLFTIIEHEPYVSMVDEVVERKKECSACDDE